MKKKEYIKPKHRVVVLQHTAMLLQASVQSINTDLEDDFILGGGSSGDGR